MAFPAVGPGAKSALVTSFMNGTQSHTWNAQWALLIQIAAEDIGLSC
jgi:hypothetical protein